MTSILLFDDKEMLGLYIVSRKVMDSSTCSDATIQ
jgi:hypothetical protein